MSSPALFTERQVRRVVGMAEAIQSARTAFRALASGTVTSPAPWHLDVTARDGTVHVKGAALEYEPYFAVKASTGFPGNAAAGLPTSDGMTMVFDSSTGRLVAALLDGGYLTELRTGAAGALALDLLAPAQIDTIAFIGTGGQARYQIAGALAVRKPGTITIYGRNTDRAALLSAWVREQFEVGVRTARLDGQRIDADAIITITSARAPVLAAAQVRPATHITAVGADSPGKRELDPALVRDADLIAVDTLDQSRTLGELQGIADDALRAAPVTLGNLLLHGAPPWTTDRISIADLSGTGAQDAAIASEAVRRLIDA
jgi:ornithine cyclodeaminase